MGGPRSLPKGPTPPVPRQVSHTQKLNEEEFWKSPQGATLICWHFVDGGRRRRQEEAAGEEEEGGGRFSSKKRRCGTNKGKRPHRRRREAVALSPMVVSPFLDLDESEVHYSTVGYSKLVPSERKTMI